MVLEHQAHTAEEQIELMGTGDRLWGMTTAFMTGHPTAVELKKVNP